jgi:aminopeptidase
MDWETQLDNYAKLAVNIGLNLRAGQRLLINAPIETAPLVHRVTEHAYRAGAKLVSVIYLDEQLEPIRYAHAPNDSFSEFPHWIASAWNQAVENGDAMLNISANDPDRLKGVDPTLVTQTMRASREALDTARQALTRNQINWCIVSVPIPSWARRIFPDLTQEQALEQLWKAIFKTVRADQPDPLAAWKTHLETLDARRAWLNAQRFDAIRLSGPGTTLEVGLVDGHLWTSGQSLAQNGVLFCANMPTEEVFTMPHRDRVNGTVRSTRPLAHAGVTMDGIQVEFQNGKIVRASATRGEDALLHLLETDAGARHIGELALVPTPNPVFDTGILFSNTLFDENAASHIALGRAYPFTLEGGNSMTTEELELVGANTSLIHVDWMVGSPEVDVDGVSQNGSVLPVMRDGTWV